MRVGVVGHVEVVEFASVPRLPSRGDIVHADSVFRVAAGGGAVAAVVLQELAGFATFWTAVGDDAVGRGAVDELRARGVDVVAETSAGSTRRGFTHVTPDGERTITVIGERLEPRHVDCEDLDGVYVTAGEIAALQAARSAARVLVATPRVGAALAESGIAVDVLVGSANDWNEDLTTDRFETPPGAVVATDGARGGTWTTADGESGRWGEVGLPGPTIDTYGAGDAFAAGVTFALASGALLPDACAAGAREGARRVTLRGPYGAS